MVETKANQIITRHIYPHVDNQNFREWTREEFYGEGEIDGVKVPRFVEAAYDPEDKTLCWVQVITDLEDDLPEEYPEGYAGEPDRDI